MQRCLENCNKGRFALQGPHDQHIVLCPLYTEADLPVLGLLIQPAPCDRDNTILCDLLSVALLSGLQESRCQTRPVHFVHRQVGKR